MPYYNTDNNIKVSELSISPNGSYNSARMSCDRLVWERVDHKCVLCSLFVHHDVTTSVKISSFTFFVSSLVSRCTEYIFHTGTGSVFTYLPKSKVGYVRLFFISYSLEISQ